MQVDIIIEKIGRGIYRDNMVSLHSVIALTVSRHELIGEIVKKYEELLCNAWQCVKNCLGLAENVNPDWQKR